MEDYILIDGEKFWFCKKTLFHGRKTMDLEVAEENFRICHSVIHDSAVRYGLMFGTLLGAIRDERFIPYDEDTDVYVLKEDKNAFLRLLPEFKDKGLELVRVEGQYVSLMRKEEYIDFYFFDLRRKVSGKRFRFLQDEFEIEAQYLETTVERPFLGLGVMVPSNSEIVLEKLYGADWRTPKRGKFAMPNSRKALLLRLFPWIRLLGFNEGMKVFFKRLVSKF